jgi:hypothetical protein
VVRSSSSTGKNLRKLSDMINHYVDGYCQHLVKWMKTHEEMKQPGGGDCWACAFCDPEAAKNHRFTDPMGYDHYFSHFSRRYFVPSLLWNALVENCRQPEYLWRGIETDLKKGDVYHVRKSLRRFLRKRIPMLLAEMDKDFRQPTPEVDKQLVSADGHSLHYSNARL